MLIYTADRANAGPSRLPGLGRNDSKKLVFLEGLPYGLTAGDVSHLLIQASATPLSLEGLACGTFIAEYSSENAAVAAAAALDGAQVTGHQMVVEAQTSVISATAVSKTTALSFVDLLWKSKYKAKEAELLAATEEVRSLRGQMVFLEYCPSGLQPQVQENEPVSQEIQHSSPTQPGKRHTLFVRNLPFTIRNQELVDIARHATETVHEAHVNVDNQDRSNGCGKLVLISSAEEAWNTISKLDGLEIQGRRIKVSLFKAEIASESTDQDDV